MNWDDLKYFLSVARSKSLSVSARSLHVSPSTVSRRIDALEQALGTQLFSRRQDGYDLTDAGANLISTAEQAEAHLLWLERGAARSETETAGTVRLAVPELLGQYILIPQLSDLQHAHPEIQLEIITDVRSTPLTKREADIAIRLTRPTHGDYTVQRIGQLSQALYASSDYLNAMGTPRSASDLAEHRFVGWDSELSYLPLAHWLEDRPEIPSLYMRTGSYHSQLMAVRAHMGIAALPRFAAELFELQRVLPEESSLVSDIWLVRQADSRRLKRVSIVSDQISRIIKGASDQLA
ncbi:LysR family transcriptional regulator [Motiliproteus sp.]|uniref:LysR family transcriptional regulator n=1 Tax=Motiliproteus sp. TaxID=1898955 RepID=UPI003BA8E97B